MHKKFLKAITISLLLSLLLNNILYANTIPDITENVSSNYKVHYPIREDAIVIVLQPFQDNSGDFTMTICNKYSRCRQTSMQYNEIRYIGVFLEDTLSAIQNDLKEDLTTNQWNERQNTFRQMYADYMNMYDKNIAPLESFTSGIIWKKRNLPD